jgi:hypothetical protein
VAVATVSGKAYFLLVNELKSRNVQFISLIPGDPMPVEAKVAITTKNEKVLVKNKRTLVFEPETEPSSIVSKAKRIIEGKENYETIVIGVDPGEVFGLAVIADGKIAETQNCSNALEVVGTIKNLIKEFSSKTTDVTIKVGNGVPIHRDLLRDLDCELPGEITLEVVCEAGTNRPFTAHRRGIRDIASATRIAGRKGTVHQRKGAN